MGKRNYINASRVFAFFSLVLLWTNFVQAQIKGVDFKKANTDKENAYYKLALNEKVFYKENDSSYIMSYPRSEVGFYDCLNKAAELCELNNKIFKEPDFNGDYKPDGFNPQSISEIYSYILADRLSIKRRWDVGKNCIILLANHDVIGVCFAIRE